jgi:hypothetical protein
MKKIFVVFLLFSFFAFGYENPQQEKIADFYDLKTNYEVKTTLLSKNDNIPDELGSLPKYVSGVAIPERGEIYLFKDRTNSYPFGSLEQVYMHELSHIYIYRSLGFRVPRWFDEGVAMKLSGEWGFADEMYLALSLPKIALLDFTLSKLEKDFVGLEGASRNSYALSRAFVKDLFVNDLDLKEFIKDIKKEGSFETAFIKRFNLNPDSAFKAWAKKLPWWGPILFLITSTNAIWLFVLVLFILASLITLRKRMQWKKKWEEEEKQSGYLQ